MHEANTTFSRTNKQKIAHCITENRQINGSRRGDVSSKRGSRFRKKTWIHNTELWCNFPESKKRYEIVQCLAVNTSVTEIYILGVRAQKVKSGAWSQAMEQHWHNTKYRERRGFTR